MRLLLLALLVALAPSAVRAQAHSADEIPALLDGIAVAWNRGDLPGHVAVYADSAEFMTGRGPLIGRQQTADALEHSFFRDGAPVQQLRFEQVVVHPLGPDYAYVTGRFILYGGGQEDHSGWFTTIWAWMDGRWQTIHDHSS